MIGWICHTSVTTLPAQGNIGSMNFLPSLSPNCDVPSPARLASSLRVKHSRTIYTAFLRCRKASGLSPRKLGMALGDNKQGVRSGPETLWFRGRFRFGAFRRFRSIARCQSFLTGKLPWALRPGFPPFPAAICRVGCVSNCTRTSREIPLIWPARSAIPIRRHFEAKRLAPDLSGSGYGNHPDTLKKYQQNQRCLADRVGFEPTVGLHLRRFSRPLP